MRETAFARLARAIIRRFAIGKLTRRRCANIYRKLDELYTHLTYPAYEGPDYQSILKRYMVEIQGQDEFAATIDSTVLAQHIKNEICRPA